MIIKRTPVALALASALFSIVAGAVALPHGPLSSTPLHFTQNPSKNSLVSADGTAAVMIVLKGEPATHAWANAFQAGGNGLVAQSSANSASRAAIASLKAEQASFTNALKASGVKYTEIYRIQRVLNGIAVRIKPADMQKVRALPNVERVAFLPTYDRPANIYSVPFVNAPQVWDAVNSLGLPFNATGTGVKIGDIDTGLDYIHPDFGGTGLLADYQNVNPTSTTGLNNAQIFPTAKVVGGTDFAGDAYTAANAPAPDPNPMDCGGHGSHTAGTLAGLGVKSDGTTYLGAYNPVAPYAANLRIGPGMAPGADLYALRVFGCGGSTNLVTEAIDWATDPNNDGDLSDRLDVINMSLGSPFGVDSASFDPDIEAVNNAALAGMIVVSAAGNSGDTFFINGAPAAANVGISAAASVDNGQTQAQLNLTAPSAATIAAAAAAYSNANFIPPPAPSGQSGNIVLVNDGSANPTFGCVTPFVNAAAVAGKIALIDRGTCTFIVKAQNAQANGAIGIIVGNNATTAGITVMGGTGASPAITIPGISISHADAATLKTDIAGGTTTGSMTTITVPALADTLASFSSRGPVTGDGGVIELKPDISAPGLNIPSVQTGYTCNGTTTTGCITISPTGFIPGGQLLTISGTSMATPHIAGMMALLRQLNPSMSVEELKALAINGAAHDVTQNNSGAPPVFGASRAGAGRIDAAASATSSVIAYNADVAGAVSVTFDVEPVGGAYTATHKVNLVNRTAVIQQVTLALDTILDSPGLSFSVPSGTINIPAGGSTSFTVTLNADTSLMTHFIDPTMATTQSSATFGFAIPRHYLAEESALIKVSNGSVELARLPVYVAHRPHSTMTTAGDLGSAAALTGTTSLLLSGQDVCTGTLAAGPTCNFNTAKDEESFVTPFELQFTGAKDTTLPGWANLHYVGINSAADTDFNTDPTTDYFFGIATHGKWGTPTYASYNVCIDTDGDGLFDKILANSDLGTLDQLFGVAGASSQDTFVSIIYDNTAGNLGPEFPLNFADVSQIDTGAHSNNVMFLAAQATDLGIATPGLTPIHYGLAVCPGFDPLCGSADWTPATATTDGVGTANCGTPSRAFQTFNGPYTYDPTKPGVDGQFNILAEDLNGATLAIPYDVNNLVANGSSGMLLLHTHNTAATSAQVVILDRIFADGFGG